MERLASWAQARGREQMFQLFRLRLHLERRNRASRICNALSRYLRGTNLQHTVGYLHGSPIGSISLAMAPGMSVIVGNIESGSVCCEADSDKTCWPQKDQRLKRPLPAPLPSS